MQAGELTLLQIIETFGNDTSIELSQEKADAVLRGLSEETTDLIDKWATIHNGGSSALGILMLVKRYGFPIDIWEAFEEVGI